MPCLANCFSLAAYFLRNRQRAAPRVGHCRTTGEPCSQGLDPGEGGSTGLCLWPSALVERRTGAQLRSCGLWALAFLLHLHRHLGCPLLLGAPAVISNPLQDSMLFVFFFSPCRLCFPTTGKYDSSLHNMTQPMTSGPLRRASESLLGDKSFHSSNRKRVTV